MTAKRNKPNKRKEHVVLGGHREDTRKVFTCLPPNTQGVSYIEIGVPEISWIAILMEELGPFKTAKVLELIADTIRTGLTDTAPQPLLTSFIAGFDASLTNSIKQTLMSAGLFVPCAAAVEDFVSLYPSFPIKWLIVKPEPAPNADYLPRFKRLLQELLDKTSPRAATAQAHLIYAAIASGAIILPPGMLENLEEIRQYPNTEKSKNLAASLRSITTMFVAQLSELPDGKVWSTYFWERGLELEPINYDQLWEQS